MDAIVYDKVGKEAEKVREALYGIYPQATITDAAIASFDDGADGIPVKALTVGVEPVQDLHGYSNPWPGGSGTNILDPSAAFTDTGIYTINSDGTVSVIASDGRSWSNIPAIELPAGTYTIARDATAGTSDIRLSSEDYGTQHIFGASYNFTLASAGGIKIKLAYNGVSYPVTIKIQLVSGSDIPTWTPYSNICPISGWTGAGGQITANAQQWDEEWEVGAISTSNGSLINVDGYIRSKNYIPVASGKTYYRAGEYVSDCRAFFYGQDKSFISHTSISGVGAFDIPYNACFMKFHKNGASYNNNISINYPATDTTYHPYTGNQISVTFPSEAGTVYGGALTLNPDRTGTLVVDSAFIEYNGSSDELWAQEGPGTATSYFRISIGERGTAVDNFVISNLYVKATITAATATIGINVLNSSAYNVSQIMVRPLNVASLTLADFLAQLATTPLQVVYKLASPQTISLTAEQVSGILTTLYGTNNIWASTGNIEKLTYRADLGKYIDSHITTAVANALNA